jgi:hypothetical protein
LVNGSTPLAVLVERPEVVVEVVKVHSMVVVATVP